jgi:uncharacterized protein involved in exopolysaccharide biosynthesis
VEDTKQTNSPKGNKTVITQKDQDELVELLQTYRTAILGHEQRIEALEGAVVAISTALTKDAKKLIVPRMDIPKEK